MNDYEKELNNWITLTSKRIELITEKIDVITKMVESKGNSPVMNEEWKTKSWELNTKFRQENMEFLYEDNADSDIMRIIYNERKMWVIKAIQFTCKEILEK